MTCDVTHSPSVTAAADYIAKRSPDGLAAVINNAGVIVEGALELVPPEDWRRVLEINVLGSALVRQKFLPLLRRGHGRVINISATSARVAPPLYGPIAASKAALESLSNAARIELAPCGPRS